MKTSTRVLLAMAATCLATSAFAQTSTLEYSLDIPRQPIASALNEFSKQTGLQIGYFREMPADIVVVSPLSGRYSVAEAMSRLLQRSGLSYEWVNAGTIAVTAPASTRSKTTAGASLIRSADIRVAGVAAEVRQSSSESDSAGSEDLARERDRHVEEVIVTAQKREQKLIDVPISISAISGGVLDDAGITNMQNLSYAVPSMSTAEVGPGRQVITIRGLGGYRGNTSLTGVYLDEMPVSGLQDGFVSTYIDLGATDLERVEVLKGPQGTLFGEGSVGGTVRFITKDPDLTRIAGKISASVYDNSDGGSSMEGTGVLNVPVVEGKFGFRVEAAYENEAGWIDRVRTVNGPVIDEDFNDAESINSRVKALWRPTEELVVKGLVVVHRGEGGGSNIVNVEPREDSNFIIEFDPANRVRTGFTDDYELYNLTATYDLEFAQLLSSSSYSETNSNASFMQRKPLIPAPNPGFQELLIPQYAQDTSSFSQEVRLSSARPGPWNWTLGGFYRDAELHYFYPVGFHFWRFGQPLMAAGQVAPGVLSVGQSDEHQSESWAAFGDVSYAITPRLELGAGVRYFEEDREKTGFVQTAPTVVVAQPFAGSFNHTTYRTNLSYGIADNAKIYGSVATGFRSGGFNSASVVANGGPATFGPETVRSYELGTKLLLADRRVSLQAALFYSEYIDIQMNSVFTTASGTPVAFTGNPGEAEIKGFEAELNWALTNRLTVSLSGDITDTELTKVDPRVLVGGQQQFQVGDPIDLVPEYSVSAGIDYSVDWSASVPGYVRLQYNQQGSNTTVLRTLGALMPITHTPVLSFLSASIGGNVMGWDCELFGRNLLDEDGALRTGGGVDPQARPRTYGVKFSRTF